MGGWFKLYDELVNDAKLIAVAEEAAVTPTTARGQNKKK